jgi:hypothetical protein
MHSFLRVLSSFPEIAVSLGIDADSCVSDGMRGSRAVCCLHSLRERVAATHSISAPWRSTRSRATVTQYSITHRETVLNLGHQKSTTLRKK